MNTVLVLSPFRSIEGSCPMERDDVMSVVVITVLYCYIAGSSSLLLGILEVSNAENRVMLIFQYLKLLLPLSALNQVFLKVCLSGCVDFIKHTYCRSLRLLLPAR